MALPHVVSVCAGAAALVLFAHVVVFVLRRRAQLDGEPDSPAVTAFGLAVCGLALATVVVSLAGASRFDEVLLLLGTAAGIMAASIPLLPAFAPRRGFALGGAPGRRAQRPQRPRPARRPQETATRGTPAGRPAQPAPARARKGRPVLPPTPLTEPLNPAPPGAGRQPAPIVEPPHGTGPGGHDTRADTVAREAHRLGLPTARPAATDAPTVPIPRIAPTPPRPGPVDGAGVDGAGVGARVDGAGVANEPRLPAPAREATETLEHLDRFVDDLTGALHLDRRDQV